MDKRDKSNVNINIYLVLTFFLYIFAIKYIRCTFSHKKGFNAEVRFSW